MTSELFQSLMETDQTVFLYLNGLYTSFGDYFMSSFSGKVIWAPMYASVLYVLLKNADWKVALYCLIAIVLTITFADQACAPLSARQWHGCARAAPTIPSPSWCIWLTASEAVRLASPRVMPPTRSVWPLC